MPGEALVDVTYRGIELGTQLKLSEFGPRTAYLEMPKPMPVGARVEMTTEGGQCFGGLVLRVNEQVAGAERPPGMHIAADALDGDAQAWWDELISRTDPVIPAPAWAPGQEPAAQDEAAGGEEAADEAAAVDTTAEDAPPAPEDAIPEPTVDDIRTKRGRTGAKRTMIMSSDEIRAAIEAGGQRPDLSDGVPDSVDGEPTDPVQSAHAGADEETDDGSNGDPRVHGKKHKKRRRKKR